MLPLEALEKNAFFSSCSQHPLACDHIILIFKAGVFKSFLLSFLITFSCVYVCEISLCLHFKKVPEMALRAHLDIPG